MHAPVGDGLTGLAEGDDASCVFPTCPPSYEPVLSGIAQPQSVLVSMGYRQAGWANGDDARSGGRVIGGGDEYRQ